MQPITCLVFAFVFLIGLSSNAAADKWAATQQLFQQILAHEDDWTSTKLAVDQIVDLSFDVQQATAGIDKLEASLTALIDKARPRNAHEKLRLLKTFIYQAGPWNGNRPFSYDMADPLGQITTHKTLAHYLATRKGNCVTMPILFAVLGKRIGLKLTLASAPRHLLVKFTDDEGSVWNLETTSGAGYTRDSYYRSELPMTDKAVSSGLYLRALSNREAVAEIASTGVEYLMQSGKYEEVIAASDVILQVNPKSAYVMIARGSAFAALLQRDFLSQHRNLDEMPLQQQALARRLSQENYKAFAHAEALGWTENDGLKEKWPKQ